MAKAKKELSASLKLVDVVVELADARAPESTRNPSLSHWNEKPRLLALTKADLADPSVTQSWLEFWRQQGQTAILLELKAPPKTGELIRALNRLLPEKRRPPRILVAGIPNVGKSTLINVLSRRAGAKTGAKPGVTRGQQWIKTRQIHLLDTPGVLWPKFDDQEAAVRLVLLAAIRDELVPWDETALWLIAFLHTHYPHCLGNRYGHPEAEHPTKEDILDVIGCRRGLLRKGGAIDRESAAKALIHDFRTQKLGRISLEMPPSYI